MFAWLKRRLEEFFRGFERGLQSSLNAVKEAKEREAIELMNKREALRAFAVYFGRVHYHTEYWRFPSLMSSDCLNYGQKEAMTIWKRYEQLQILHSVAFIDAFMEGWQQGMADRF